MSKAARKASLGGKITTGVIGTTLAAGAALTVHQELGLAGNLSADQTCGRLAPPELLGAAQNGLVGSEKAKNTGECAQLVDTVSSLGTMRRLGSLPTGQEFTIECKERSGIPSWRVKLPDGQEGDVALSGETMLHVSNDPAFYDIKETLQYCPLDKKF